MLKTTSENQPFDEIKKALNAAGYKLVYSQYSQMEESSTFVHEKNFHVITINQGDTDNEDFWNIFGVGEEDIKEKLEELNKTAVPYTDEELNIKINEEDEDYNKVIRDLIEEACKR